MATDGIKQLRSALFTRLSADSTLLTLAQGIYEYRGPAQAYPYVYIGEMNAKEWSKLGSKGMEVSVTIEVETRDKDSGSCGDIIARIHTLLHRASFSVTGYALQFSRWLDSSLSETQSGYAGRSHFLIRIIES